MADDQEQPRRGRPKSAKPLETQVSTRIAPSDYDRLVKIANRREQSVASLVRSLILIRLE